MTNKDVVITPEMVHDILVNYQTVDLELKVQLLKQRLAPEIDQFNKIGSIYTFIATILTKEGVYTTSLCELLATFTAALVELKTESGNHD